MGIITLILLIIFVGSVVGIIISTNAKSLMAAMVSGDEKYINKTCVIKLADNKLIVKELFEKEPFLVLNKEDIESINSYAQEATTEKNKSVIGRAIVGGALFGEAGALVGGMSGIGKKTVSKQEFYFSVKTKDNQELLFKLSDAGRSLTATSIQKKLTSCVA